MINKYIFIATAALAIGGLSGCASAPLERAWNDPGPSLAQTAKLKGRAFVLRSVSVAPNASPKGEVDKHCLPNSMYAAMLRSDLEQAFQKSGLEQGKQPAVPVDVVIMHREFGTNVAISQNSTFIARVKFDKVAALVGLSGTPGWAYTNEDASLWGKQQRLIPTMALKITGNLLNIQAGRRFTNGPSHGGNRSPVSYFGYSDMSTYGLTYPMTPAEIEQDTGKTSAQLDTICKARIAANN